MGPKGTEKMTFSYCIPPRLLRHIDYFNQKNQQQQAQIDAAQAQHFQDQLDKVIAIGGDGTGNPGQAIGGNPGGESIPPVPPTAAQQAGGSNNNPNSGVLTGMLTGQGQQ